MIYDYIIVGSGIGGSVAALRLDRNGYSVQVIGQGKRFVLSDIQKSEWNLSKYLWAPSLSFSVCRGFPFILQPAFLAEQVLQEADWFIPILDTFEARLLCNVFNSIETSM